MKPRFCATRSIAGLFAIGCVAAVLVSRPAAAGVTLYDKDNLSIDLGFRLQPRLEVAGTNTGRGWTRDFLIRRARLKANGKLLSALFLIEWKVDNTDALPGATPVTPSAQIENAYLQYDANRYFGLRFGLYDQPFSRDRLTSDSKQLAVDRGAASDFLAGVGLADNAFGLQAQGLFAQGTAQYAIGAFDNVKIEGARQLIPMVVGRIDLNFGGKNDIYKDTHFGTDQAWYCLGVNGSYQGGIENAAGAREGSNAAFGVDGMVDLPMGGMRWTARGEFDTVQQQDPAGGNTLDTRVWMAGLGLMLHRWVQPIVRFDQVLPDVSAGGGSRNITYAGLNYFRDAHRLKIQSDVRFEAGTRYAVDGGRLQAQLDF